MASIRPRKHFEVATRPKKNIAGEFPLSENSLFLETDDPQTAALFLQKHGEAMHRDDAKRRLHSSLRLGRQRELTRRIAERETVENYIQTPFMKAKGPDGMHFGINVFDGRMQAPGRFRNKVQRVNDSFGVTFGRVCTNKNFLVCGT
jgi:hypothetical protein